VGSSWNPAATLPPRRDPHRPCQTRDSGYLRNAERADWFRIATRVAPDDAPRRSRRTTLVPATSRVSVLRTSNPGVDSRCLERVATLVAEQHADRSTTEPSGPDRGPREPRLARSTLLLHPAASTRTPTPPAAYATADWTQPITHMRSEPMMLPPSPRQELRTRPWECAELHHTPDARTPGFPDALAPQRSSAPSPASWSRPRPIAVLYI
jgi:hypothetical protein